MRPPYIDPDTGVAYDTDKGEYEGYLTKQSMWLRVSDNKWLGEFTLCRGSVCVYFPAPRIWTRNLIFMQHSHRLTFTYAQSSSHTHHVLSQDWRRRYFILKGSRLFFAKTPYEAPHGMIDLSRCTTVKSADLKAHKKHSFEISTPETTYLLYAGELVRLCCVVLFVHYISWYFVIHVLVWYQFSCLSCLIFSLQSISTFNVRLIQHQTKTK